ncbi:MAG: glycosyltransferase family 4 protein [Nanoarchaeota archaeon]
MKIQLLDTLRFELKKLVHKPLKVGIISVGYPEEGKNVNSGGSVYPYYLARELARLGVEVHVFCKGDKQYIKKEYVEEGKLIIHRIKVKIEVPIEDPLIASHMSNFIFDNKLIEELTKENKKEKFNIINSNGGLTGGTFIAKYFNNVKWINTIHLLEKNRQKFFTSEQKRYLNIFNWVESTIREADALISVSNHTREEMIKTYKVEPSKIFYIPNGIDPEIFNNKDAKKEKVISYVGRFSLEKGIENIPIIIQRLLQKDSNINFEIVAADKGVTIPSSLLETQKEFERLVEKYPEKIKWHRECLSRKDLAEIFKKSIITIQPSKYEAFGMTVLEAMACGAVPVTSNRGGLPEVVGNAGIVLPLNINLFVRNILKLAEDYKLRERYARRGLKKVENFTWNKIARQIYDLYKVVSRFKENKNNNSAEALNSLEELHKKDIWEQENEK